MVHGVARSWTRLSDYIFGHYNEIDVLFPFPAAAAAKSLQSCPTLCNPIDGSPPGFPSLGFSRQEHWSGLPFPSPMHESENEVTQLCPTLSDPMDCSLPGSSIHGIFQAKVLEWGAIVFSDTYVYIEANVYTEINRQMIKIVKFHFL